MLYLAARTRNRATVVLCIHEAHSAALREFWTEWLPTETQFLLFMNTKRRPQVTTTVARSNLGFGFAVQGYAVGASLAAFVITVGRPTVLGVLPELADWEGMQWVEFTIKTVLAATAASKARRI